MPDIPLAGKTVRIPGSEGGSRAACGARHLDMLELCRGLPFAEGDQQIPLP